MISNEEKEFVFLHRTAKSPSKLALVQLQLRSARRIPEIVVGIQSGVPEEFKRAAVKTVGAGLGDDVDVGARIAAVASIVIRGLNLEFLDGVRIRGRKRA